MGTGFLWALREARQKYGATPSMAQFSRGRDMNELSFGRAAFVHLATVRVSNMTRVH
jgi:hypothetical protein